MIKYIPFLFLLFLSNPYYAQDIRGQVYDEHSLPMEYVNVILYQEGDIQLLKGTVTDSLGDFGFDQLKIGKYYIVLQIYGYVQDTIFFTMKDESILLEKQSMAPDTKVLDDVVIVGKRALIEKTTLGFVVNTEATLSQLGGTAVDVLRNTPVVFVDGEGAVSLRGKPPLILINGRNSTMTNLLSIPSSSIKKIEIITNPSAAYDAEAENGIINIILKKGGYDGINGAFAFGTGYGARPRLNSSALINIKVNSLNFGLAYDNRFAQRKRQGVGERINFNLPDEYHLAQRRKDNRDEETHNIRLNLDYDKGKNQLSFEGIVPLEYETNLEDLISTFENQNNEFVSKKKRFSEEIRNTNKMEWALNYDRKFNKEGKKLSFNASTSKTDGKENTLITTQNILVNGTIIDAPYFQQTSFGDHSNIANVRLDYKQPMSKGIFETGYKCTMRFSKNDFSQADKIEGRYQIVPQRTGVLNFKETVNALYTQYKWKKNKWDYEAGIRGEQTSNNGNVSGQNITIDNSYLKIFPTLNVAYHIDQNQNLRMLYGKRINRPTLGQLNPFTDITDSLTQRSGNPKLQPEIVHNIELAYSLQANKNSLSLKAYFRKGFNTILQYTSLQGNGILYSELKNIGNQHVFGIEQIFTYNPSERWQGNLSAALFNQVINADNIQAKATNTVLSWNIKWFNEIGIWKNGKIQLISIYNSPTATLQGTRIAVYNTDLAFQQKILKDKGRIGVIVSDIFNTQKSGFSWRTDDFQFDRTFKIDTRAILINFGYTFGAKFKDHLMKNQFLND